GRILALAIGNCAARNEKSGSDEGVLRRARLSGSAGLQACQSTPGSPEGLRYRSDELGSPEGLRYRSDQLGSPEGLRDRPDETTRHLSTPAAARGGARAPSSRSRRSRTALRVRE